MKTIDQRMEDERIDSLYELINAEKGWRREIEERLIELERCEREFRHKIIKIMENASPEEQKWYWIVLPDGDYVVLKYAQLEYKNGAYYDRKRNIAYSPRSVFDNPGDAMTKSCELAKEMELAC